VRSYVLRTGRWGGLAALIGAALSQGRYGPEEADRINLTVTARPLIPFLAVDSEFFRVPQRPARAFDAS
jgi:hypothetical protein